MQGFEFKSRLICPDTWLIESDGCTSYLLMGSDEGLVIDPGYGVYDTRAYAESVTGRRVALAANTHGHFDHAGGNGFFEKAYMSEAADKPARTPYPSFKGQTFKLDYPSVFVHDGFKLDLGGRELEVFEIPAHSPSSVAFLDKKQRILFTGDEIKPNVPLMWQQEAPQPTIQQYIRNVLKVLARRDEYDYICPGHGEDILDAAYVEKCLACASSIIDGNEGEQFVMRQPKTVEEAGKGPRPGDLVVYNLEYKRVASFDGVSIIYDKRYV